MSDGTLSPGTVDAPIEAPPAPAEAPASSTGADETQLEQAGGESSSDGGSATGQAPRQRGKSVYSQVREMQAKLRDQRGYWESEVGTLKQQLEEIRSQMQGQGPKQGKTFWEAPEELIDSRFERLEKSLQAKFEETQAQREQASLRQQEVSEAAKFIRTQKGLTEDDIQDIRDILKDNPQLENLPPMDQAEFALFKWQKERGITDNSAKKARASTVTGAPAQGAGPKMWTESEIDAEIKKFPADIRTWTPDQEAKWKQLDDEFRRAYREKRVSK